jgi:hypothetical protein
LFSPGSMSYPATPSRGDAGSSTSPASARSHGSAGATASGRRATAATSWPAASGPHALLACGPSRSEHRRFHRGTSVRRGCGCAASSSRNPPYPTDPRSRTETRGSRRSPWPSNVSSVSRWPGFVRHYYNDGRRRRNVTEMDDHDWLEEPLRRAWSCTSSLHGQQTYQRPVDEGAGSTG